MATSKNPKAVKLTFNMGLGVKKVVEALSAVKGASKEVRKTFAGIMEAAVTGKFIKGESMTLEWTGKGRVVIGVHGVKQGEVNDQVFAKGLLGMYLGKNTVRSGCS